MDDPMGFTAVEEQQGRAWLGWKWAHVLGEQVCSGQRRG